MTATPSSAAATDAAGTSAFPLATAAAATRPVARVAAAQVGAARDGDGGGGSGASIAWRFPALPDAVAEAARTAFGVTVLGDETAEDPRDLPAFAALYAHARAEQVVRALARRTNLVLPAASALVIGDGPVADVISTILSRGGTRVTRGIGDPVARLSAHLAGVRTTTAPWPATDLVITTGEHVGVEGEPNALRRSLSEERSDERRTERAERDEVTKGVTASGVLIDASLDPDDTTAGETVRAQVTKIGTRSWRVTAPGIYETGDGASVRPTRVADALVALSILRATADASTADALLAELVLA